MKITRECSIQDCGKPEKAKGLCSMHYSRLTRNGDPLIKLTTKGEPQKFYRDVVLPYDGNECLIWPYAKTKGYGTMTKDGERGIVSRFLCEDTKGAPPTPKHEAAHSCGNGKFGCVTKRHISWKTPAENQADRLAHGTHNRGERCGTSKLTEREAREILSLKGKESQRSIAKRFGIIQQTVSQIHSKKTWAWLSAEEAINSALSRTRSLEAAE